MGAKTKRYHGQDCICILPAHYNYNVASSSQLQKQHLVEEEGRRGRRGRKDGRKEGWKEERKKGRKVACGHPLRSTMSCAVYLDGNATPKSMSRAKRWTDEVENLYRFQQAGYRDELEYKQIDRWPETGFVKKLQRRDNTFYYYNRKRECEDREVHKVKVYAY
ncbi:meiosis expressed gene 1 protein homolog isoform X2 [Salmo salar]|uniref:Meiosis expressed gene 1 protein homolog isoform X2 n=1 Tax=Salmo salar TaxID=8030 RepID=A0ABM3EBF6_SALSA|nr:meiosis expressed gene 1 protein homolog isoform X2 [Salmo salar]